VLQVKDFLVEELCKAWCSAQVLVTCAAAAFEGRSYGLRKDLADTHLNRCRGFLALVWALQDSDKRDEADEELPDLPVVFERTLFLGVFRVEGSYFFVPPTSSSVTTIPEIRCLLGLNGDPRSKENTKGFATAAEAAEAFDERRHVCTDDGLPFNFCFRGEDDVDDQQNWFPDQERFLVPGNQFLSSPSDFPKGFVALTWGRNSCFVSAGLQLLFHLEPLSSTLRDFGHKLRLKSLNADRRSLTEVGTFLTETFIWSAS